MTPQQKIAFSLWNNSQAAKEHEYGRWDCFIAFLDMMDYVYGTDLVKKYQFLYSDRKSALRWYRKEWDLTMDQFLYIHGWRRQEQGYEGRDGDVRVEQNIYPILYIHYDGLWWVMTDQGWRGFTGNAFRDVKYTTWTRDK
jgi:hypothetical protein